MISILNGYDNPYNKDINMDLINKTGDRDLVEYIKDVFKSLEILKNIKITKFEYTEKESEININDHIFRRQKNTKKKYRHDIKSIEDDRCGKLSIYMDISVMETDPKTGVSTMKIYPVKKSILIPLVDDDGYYTIKGKKYYMIYQMLEKSTYTSSNAITLKSLMPIAVKRNVESVSDINDIKYELPYYSVFIFRKEVPVLLFYAGKSGMSWTIDFLGMNGIVSFVSNSSNVGNKNDNENIYFQISSKLLLKVNKKMFEKHTFVKSVVGGILHISSNRITIENMEDTDVWVKKITPQQDISKGYSILASFSRLLDETTRKILKIPEFYRNDIYSLLLWMMHHYNELRLKDNCDLKNKRLRCNEYISSLLTKEFSKRLNRILAMGNKANIDNIKEIFKFPGDILISKMHTSGILRFDDNVNDMTFFSKLKYTNKGPNSLGGKNANNISIKYRDLHPSMLGNIDVLVCGNSDPGTSGRLSQFAKMDGLYFDSSEEVSDFMYNLNNELVDMYNKDGELKYIMCNFENPTDYYNCMQNMRDFTNNGLNVYGTSRECQYDIVIEQSHDMDDQSKPSTVGLRKKTSTNKTEDAKDDDK